MKSTLPTSGAHRAAPTTQKFNSGETKADQESAKFQSIDFILNQFTKGVPLPITDTVYQDLSLVPNNLTDMQDSLDRVYNVFNSLPSALRAQMNNDVRNYPAFAASEQGIKQLTEHGYIKAQEPEAPKAADVEPAPKDVIPPKASEAP